MHEIPQVNLETERLILHTLGQDDAVEVSHYLRLNRNHFQDSGPHLSDEFYSPEYQARHLKEADWARRRGERLRVYLRSRQTGELVGDIGLSNLFWGGFRSGVIGYKIAQHLQGQGLIREALTAFLAWAYPTLDLQRIEANIRPDNIASIRVAGHLGFHCEGLSPQYLEINGERKDHLRFTLLRTHWERGPGEWVAHGFAPVVPVWSPRTRLRTYMQGQALVGEVVGTYRVGDLGYPDGEYLFAEIAAALYRSGAHGLIWDFRQMAYTWGDGMLRLLAVTEALFPEQYRPVAVIYSALNAEGIASLIGAKQGEWPQGYFPEGQLARDWMVKALAEYEIPMA